MGNCMVTRGSSSSMVWAEEDDGDEWEWVSKQMVINTTDDLISDGSNKTRRGPPLSSSSPSSSPSSYCDGKVKITISKKQLSQLLRKGEITNSSSKNNNCNDLNAAAAADELQLLARLLLQVDTAAAGGGSDDPEMAWCQRPWRPRLQSIPELN